MSWIGTVKDCFALCQLCNGRDKVQKKNWTRVCQQIALNQANSAIVVITPA